MLTARDIAITNRFAGTRDALDKLIPHRMAFRDEADDGTVNYRIAVAFDEFTYWTKLRIVHWLQRVLWNIQSAIRIRLGRISARLAHIENQARLGN